MCKAIAGAITLTSGDYLIDGRKVAFASPEEALRGGVAMVYQESSLVPSMTVAQNLELGMEKFFTVYSKINIAATQSLQSMNFNVDPLALVENLGTAKRQMVEIVRAVRHNAKVFIFDEPTASLTPEETQHLFHLLNTLKERGAGIIFISHALEEALEIADRITVLRDGKLVATSPAQGMTRDALVRMMIGRDVTASHYATHGADPEAVHAAAKRGEKALSVENVTMGGIVKNMSFSVFDGEVVGIFGLVGAGRSEIAQIICGARKRNFLRGGMIYLRGKPVRYRVPRQAIRDGIAYITEDRKVDGFFETMTVDQNIYLGFLASPRVRRLLLFDAGDEADRRSVDQRAVDLGAEAQPEDRRIFRRQSAEGRRRQVAGAGAVRRHLRRADARRRRQRDSADSRRDSQAGRRKQGGGGDIFLPAGNPGDLRPRPGRARRPDRRGNVGRRRDGRQDHVCRHSLSRESK